MDMAAHDAPRQLPWQHRVQKSKNCHCIQNHACYCLHPFPMPKAIARSKTRKSVAKRFKITGTGKVVRNHASRRHLLASKNAKKKRHMAKSAVVDETDVARIKACLPFSH
jgi:large subunit ribosomal protein L35